MTTTKQMRETKFWFDALPGFHSRQQQSTKDGYGNRVVTTCAKCGAVVMDADPGNGAGFRYDRHYREKAMQQHQCNAARAGA